MKFKGNRFYLPALMRISALNVRGFADQKPSVTAEEYFELLSALLNQAPAVLNVLAKTGKQNFSCLPLIKTALEEIGCYDFSQELDKIYRGGVSANEIQSFAARFSDFYKRILNLKNVPKSLVGENNAHNPAYINLLKHDLPYIIEQLDCEEAQRKLQILVVDDSALILKSISAVLSDKYKVYTLAKPTMAEMVLDQIVPELFILDYKMPGMSGFDLVHVIRARPEHKDTPIIFLTAEGTAANLSMSLELGARDFIVKPFNADILLLRVAENIVRKKTF
ncbi:MAG: response regulator [Oscillospiraceae bacterium]|nr:response regulator [Oscillospiraceae bacterium]